MILPNLYFNEAGIYRIRLRNQKTNEIFISPPIKCFQENDRNLFWGLLHGESERVDSTENIESCLRHFRDDKTLNFFATSPFDNPEETSNDIWKAISQNVLISTKKTALSPCSDFSIRVRVGKKECVSLFIRRKGSPFYAKKRAKLLLFQKFTSRPP